MNAVRLNLGSGQRPAKGYVNIDRSPTMNPDLVVDLEDGHLPYDDNSVEEISASHILEHIRNIIPLMNECYRVLKPGGQMSIHVPQGDGIWCDPTHVRAFNKLSWRYFCNYPFDDAYGITCKFNLVYQKFHEGPDGGVLVAVLSK